MSARKTILSFALSAMLLVTVYGQGNEFKTYSNYDFVPGNKVLFFDDFTAAKIGDFPAMWNTNGSGEVVTADKTEGKWFKINPNSMTFTDAGLKYTENFSIEFDLIVTKGEDNLETVQISLFSSDPEIGALFPTDLFPGKEGIVMNFATLFQEDPDATDAHHNYRVYNNKTEKWSEGKYSKVMKLLKLGKTYRFSIWVQKTRLRLYIDEEKIYDIQRAFPEKSKIDQIRFWTPEFSDASLFLANFRYADAGEDTRSKFMTEGKLVSYGIYFDSGKDIVKPQSYGAIREMAGILKDNPQVKVLIVGHTDSDGDDAKNLDLSKRRAGNVKKVLVSEFKIDESRITTDGKGEVEPVAPNTNAENKALNRRVEFMKQ